MRTSILSAEMSTPRFQLLDLCPHSSFLFCDPSSCHGSFCFLSLADSDQFLSRICLLCLGVDCPFVFTQSFHCSLLNLPSGSQIVEILQFHCNETRSFRLSSPVFLTLCRVEDHPCLVCDASFLSWIGLSHAPQLST